ncbi:MAG: DUF2779 domain-containing protein [Fimbriimonadaceae bacterium]|nr:DUF2779 domain-containing protein [Fimbriimonadaceae bacterium]
MRLSKSLFRELTPCDRRFWLSVHRRDLNEQPGADEELRKKIGEKIGRLATRAYLGGVYGAFDPSNPESAMAKNLAAMEDGCSAIFEATFVHGELLARVDILARNLDGGWDIVEVKSGMRVDPKEHVADVAFQWHVLSAAGIAIDNAYIMHLNPDYRAPSDYVPDEELNISQLFTITEVTKWVENSQVQIGEEIDVALRIAHGPEPSPAFNSYCRNCPYNEPCAGSQPRESLWRIPTLREASVSKLAREGYVTVHDLPDHNTVPPTARHIAQSLREERDITDEKLIEQLRDLAYPIGFIDFEAIDPPLPRHQGHKPYERLPFQWSLHVMNSPDDTVGDLIHREFLHEDPSDPTPGFAATLLDAIQDCNTLLYYSNYEPVTIDYLVRRGIPYAEALKEAFRAKGYDLYESLKKGTYWRAFGSSLSIKSVLPAVAPDTSYADQVIQNGAQAVVEYIRMTDPQTPKEERQRIADALRSYCGLDTKAMVLVFLGLRDANG